MRDTESKQPAIKALLEGITQERAAKDKIKENFLKAAAEALELAREAFKRLMPDIELPIAPDSGEPYNKRSHLEVKASLVIITQPKSLDEMSKDYIEFKKSFSDMPQSDGSDELKKHSALEGLNLVDPETGITFKGTHIKYIHGTDYRDFDLEIRVPLARVLKVG